MRGVSGGGSRRSLHRFGRTVDITARLAPPSLRRLAFVMGWALLTLLASSSSVTATTDPNPEIPVEPQHPFSERCQRAINTFSLEYEWFLHHNVINWEDPRFIFHYDRLWDAWFIAETECGIDIDNNGVPG